MKRVKGILLATTFLLMGCRNQNTRNDLQSREEISHEEISTFSKDLELLESEEQTIEIMETQTSEEEDMENRLQDFYQLPLSEEIKQKITGCSYPATTEKIEITYEDLAYVHVLHYDFENKIQEGEIICNKELASDFVEIFKELFENQYQIEKIRLVDEYKADDLKSMADNNTSAFNYRVISGTDKLSNHSFGRAIDINPLYNPYIFFRNNLEQVQPLNAGDYVDRTKEFVHKIDHNDLCYQIFIKHGFTWGGDWKNSKDYQHFEKK